MIMEIAQALTRPITRLPDITLIKKSPTMGIPFPLGIGQAVGTSSTPELARLPSSPDGV
jgi:hypothetical protein